MDITKIQKVLRKAIKDYNVKSNIDEEALVAFVCVDIYREIIEVKKS